MDNEKIIADLKTNTNIVAKKLRYPALRTISEAYNLMAFCIGVVTLGAALILCTKSIWYGLILIVVGAITVLGLFAVSEAIKVFIDIEENTRLRNKE